MLTDPRFAALAVAAILALPGTAIAQSAGDNQYQDPFAGQGGGGSAGSGQGTQGSGSGGSQSGGGQGGQDAGGGGGGQSVAGQASDTGSTPASTASGSSGAPGTTTGSARQLPRTGGEPALIALVGAGLTLGGLGLRRRVVRPRA